MIINVEVDGNTYAVSITDIHSRPILAEIDGEVFKVWPQENSGVVQPEIEHKAQANPIPIVTGTSTEVFTQSTSSVTAPLPGVILSIDVRVGETINVGQPLCTLEAMKMKNAIRSNREGVIAGVHVANGDLVKHGQTLFTFKE